MEGKRLRSDELWKHPVLLVPTNSGENRPHKDTKYGKRNGKGIITRQEGR